MARISRRSSLLWLGGLAAGLTAACAAPQPAPPKTESKPADAPKPTSAPAAAPVASPAASPVASPSPAAAVPQAAPAVAKPAAGGVLRVAQPIMPKTLDPITGTVSHNLSEMGAGETLMKINSKGEIVPSLAESIEATDAQKWRIKLRDGIKFWNGKPLNAEALKLSLSRTLEKSPSAANLLRIASLNAVDARTLEVTTKDPNGGLVANFANYFTVIHDAEEAAKVGDQAFGIAPVLTGPYMPVDFKPDTVVTMRRFEGYWGGVPALERVEMRPVSDGNARLAGLLAGDVDIARQLPPQGIGQVRTAGHQLFSIGSAYIYHLFLNNGRAPFDQLPVRKAISLAVDRKLLVERVLGGSGDVATGPFPNFYPFAAKDEFPVDASKARQALEDAGWKAGGDGVRAKDGKKLEFTLLTYPQRPELGLLATAIQAQLKDIGVAAKIESTENIGQPVDSGNYDAAMYAWQPAPSGDPDFALNLFYGSGGSRNKQIAYKSAKMDELVTKLNATTAAAQRAQVAADAQKLLREEEPVVYICAPKYHTGASTKVKGFEAHPVEAFFLDNKIGLG
jgi:peptide/nickel transport system substrate-binding protein